MKFTIEQLERYVQAIDLYESDEAQWLRDKGLEHRRLLIAASPELSSFALAIDDAKAELAVNSVEIARQLIAAEKARQKLREELALLSSKLGVRADNAQKNGAFSSAVAFRETAHDLIKILEGRNE